MLGEEIKIGTRHIGMRKSVRYTNFEAESVLCNDPWLFVELWLKRNKKKEALAFWLQARRFSETVSNMSVEAAPLTQYYAFLNATNALLEVRGPLHRNRHGVSGERPEKAKTSLENEKVKFQSGGVLPALCAYLGDNSPSQEYSLKDLLWNLPFVHRAFQHTYKSNLYPELFIPLQEACYVSMDDTSEGWFQAQVVPRYADGRILKNIPSSFKVFKDEGQTYVRRKKPFKWLRGRTNRQDKSDALVRLGNYHATTRRVIVTISGNRDFWYLKKSMTKNSLSERHSLAILP